MQKEYNNIDDLFKSELSGLETNAPESVKSALDGKLRRKKYIFILLPLLIFIPIVSVLMSNYINIDNSLSNNKPIQSTGKEVVPYTFFNPLRNDALNNLSNS